MNNDIFDEIESIFEELENSSKFSNNESGEYTDWIYCHATDPGLGTPYFVVVPRLFFEENGCIMDEIPNVFREEMNRRDFHEAMESYFEYNGTVEDGVRAMESLGIGYSQDLQDFMDS